MSEKKVNLIIILTGIALASFSWFFGFRPFLVNGLSMYPNFNSEFADNEKRLIKGDYLIVNIFSYVFLEDPDRFDVVVFRKPREEKTYLIKRIIGLPNETVRLFGRTVEITKADGETVILEEPYLNKNNVLVYRDKTIKLGEDEYFALGDNRSNSLDSRKWGALNRNKIIGRPILRLYPLNQIDLHPGKFDIEI